MNCQEDGQEDSNGVARSNKTERCVMWSCAMLFFSKMKSNHDFCFYSSQSGKWCFLLTTIRHENITYLKWIFSSTVSRFRFFGISFGQNYPISFVEIISKNHPLGVAVHSVPWWAIHGKCLPDFCSFFPTHVWAAHVSGPQRLIISRWFSVLLPSPSRYVKP